MDIDLLELVPRAVMVSFFKRKKTAISSQVDNTHTFLTQLRDHNLLSEDLYQARRLKSLFFPLLLK